MIVKNEAHIIADTLHHLWKYIQFDYWVVSDTGSTDQTREIVKAFFQEKGVPGELQEEPWRDFGYNRTKAFEAAYGKADYAFVWDADDEISGDFKMPADLTADSYKFVFGNAEGMRYSRGQLFSMKKRWCYKGVLHEYADCLEPAGPMIDVTGDYFFISGRRGDRSKDPNKYLKDALVLEKASEKALAEKDPLYNRYIFYCAQSYNSCNMKEKAIEFYKKALTLPLWIQEKYVSCLEIYDKYEELGKPEEGLYYLVESYKHDTTRLECFYRLIKHYCIHGPQEVAYAYYTVVQDFYENHYDGSKLGEKLFAKKNEYDFFLPYYMIIVAERVGKLKTCAKMYEAIFKHQYAFAGEWWIRNLIHNMQFCINELPESLEFVNNFFTYMRFLKSKGVNLEPSQLVVINKMINRYKGLLGSAIKPSFSLTSSKPSVPIKVMLTMTSCKRWDLFEKTVNSLLHTWTDLDKVGYFFCVDDNSSQRDRTKMQTTFPFIDFYMKRSNEKGHRASMNIIYDKLTDLKPTYWIHMEDDWLFFEKDAYVQKSIDFLNRNESNDIHQILYNRNYAETYEGWTINGGEAIAGSPGFLLHVKSDSIPGQNCGYWPHYSFRPSMVRTRAVLELGNYDSPNNFFERDYADKYFAKGYKSAFFDTVCCLHTGKLTSDKTGTNAYALNKTGQFNGDASLKGKELHFNTFIINLLRRTDRREAMEVEFEKAGLDEHYEFFEAVDGKDLVLTDEINQLFLGNDFGSRKGVIGCALSHYALWKQLVASDSEYYTIFEDDVTLCVNFKARWEEACKTESDITFLGFTSRDRTARTTQGAIPVVPLDLEKYIGGFFGYIITKAGAKKLLDYIAQKGIKHGIDYLVKVVPGLKCSAVQPHIVQTEWFSSSESKVDTDIQKDYSSLQIKATVNEAEWDFHEGVDSGGSDIVRSDSRDPKGLMAAAAASGAECVAFNTLGYLKSRVRFPLGKSPWLHAPDGLYVKKGYKPSTRVKMLCNWCSSEDLCKEWMKMCKGASNTGTYRWNNLEITWSDEDIDYYVIINKPRPGDKYVAEKSIVYHMEPWCFSQDQGWGVKTWGEWAKPDPRLFLQVRSHDKFVNPVFWQVNLTFDKLQTMDISSQKKAELDKVVSSVCSSKYFDPGHKKRIDFLKYLETKSFPLHIYNEDNQHEFKSYQGKARPFVDKEKGLVPYKYYFICENNAERNFITEKLWEPILCESLCFYWGCPNVADIVDPRAFVQLDMNDFESAYNTMNAAIQMNLWEERLPFIKAAKKKILDNSFFPILEKVLKPKAVCFIHSCHLLESGTEKLDLILDAVLKVKELEVITINNIGLRLDPKYESMDPRIIVVHCSDNSQEFELPTLRLMHEFSLNSPNTKILYVHTKGISYPKGDSRYEPGLDWINYMLHFLCEKSEHCLNLLDTHDVAGCNFSENPKPHFSGNFWWATAKYLKGLDTGLLTDKMSAEWWLQSSPVKPVKATLWNSGKNHFHERYPEEEYNNKIKIFVVFHNALFDHLYSEMSESDKTSIVTYGVKTRVPSPFKTIYEADLPEYNPRLQQNIYNEGSAFYHIYKNGLYKDSEYIGFGQYDMKIKSNTLTDIRKTIQSSKSPCIFVMDYFPDIKNTGFLGCHNLIKSDLNGLESGLTTYNRAFNTSYTADDVIQNRLIMCNTFVIHKSTFEKMMGWLMQYYRDDINVNRHHLIGNAGQIPEALIGMFLSLEVLGGATYYKFDVEHIWPLYKNIANTKIPQKKKGLILLLGESFRSGLGGTRERGNPESYTAQIEASKTHMQFIQSIKEAGVDVSVFLSTYTTQYSTELINLYSPYLVGNKIFNSPVGLDALFHTSIHSTNDIDQYDFVLFIRVDLVLKGEFTKVFDPEWKTIRFPSICWLKDSKVESDPRVNDMMLYIPKMYYKYLNYIQYTPTGHNLWHDLLKTTSLTNADFDTMINTYHDSDSNKDWNPLYYISNRPESTVWHSEGHTFNKAIQTPK